MNRIQDNNNNNNKIKDKRKKKGGERTLGGKRERLKERFYFFISLRLFLRSMKIRS